MIDISKIETYLKKLQLSITNQLSQLDGHSFRPDVWEKNDPNKLKGHGITSILEEGNIFERAGVGFSSVIGEKLPPAAINNRPELIGSNFKACGVSVVIHPRNPYCPTVHLNVRFFIALKNEKIIDYWYGGGMDLTPYYGFEEDAIHFHQSCKNTLDNLDKNFYPIFKKNCDDYFFLKHRNERRGIGGIFFDNFKGENIESGFKLIEAVGSVFLSSYLPIIEKRNQINYGERERDFQAYRRGRYVEFNLVFDRGTLFGLQSGGRTESILLSMPPIVKWRYNWQPETNSEEEKLYRVFLTPRDWIHS